jgi:NTP pyrophosphatase (non-canonical NTP hydrolase)
MTTLRDLQDRCARTTLRRTEPDAMLSEALAMAALWLASEAGEVATEVRKATAEREPWHDIRVRLREELGDVLWCVAEVATLAHLSLDECAAVQAQKQEERYPQLIRLHDTEGR